jgi:mRNA export factor
MFVEGKTKSEKSFPYKCHRVNDDVYSVNDIKFHPQFNVFASVGSGINFF